MDDRTSADTTPLGDDARRALRGQASPEGIVSILFTDIVESTRFRQRVGDTAAQERLRAHNQIVREQIRKNGGREVKTQGDGFMVAFSDVVAALECAVDIQRAVAADNDAHPTSQLQVRMGLNCGNAIKEEEDFHGGVVIVAARIGAMAKGGEILVSEAVRVLAGLPRGIGYVRHGRHRLKGLSDTYGLWAVPWDGEEVRGLAKLRRNPSARVAAALVIIGVGGGIAGWMLLGKGGGATAPTADASVFQDVGLTFKAAGVAHIQRGDCASADLIIDGGGDGDFSGDATGHLIGTGQLTGHAADRCQTGFFASSLVATLVDGNTIDARVEGPIKLIGALSHVEDVSGAVLGSAMVVTITGGTGIYEGVSGSGTCSAVLTGHLISDGSLPYTFEGDCKLQVALATAHVPAPAPIVAQLAASQSGVTLSGDASDPRRVVVLAVVYGNTGDDTERGLSLHLLVPPGTTMNASALGEPYLPAAGERIWSLPDLPSREINRFEFSVQIKDAVDPTVPLKVQVEGKGIEPAIETNAIAITVQR